VWREFIDLVLVGKRPPAKGTEKHQMMKVSTGTLALNASLNSPDLGKKTVNRPRARAA